MEVVLVKDGKKVMYKAGPALYLICYLVPFGGIVGLILAISNKQFRGVCLNMLFIELIMGLGFILAIVTDSLALLKLLYLVFLLVYYYMLIIYIIHANSYSVRQRLAEGYEVTQTYQAETKRFVANAAKTKPQFWQLTKF